MLYSVFEIGQVAMTPARFAAGLGAQAWRSPLNPFADFWPARASAAALDVFENMTRRYPKPEWGLDLTTINGVDVPISVEPALVDDFATLLHFKRDEAALAEAGVAAGEHPPVLIVAPLSGHFATLLRGTVEAMLPGHDVYITDWTNARDVPLYAGRFDLNDFIDYVIAFLHRIYDLHDRRAHAMAVCQPGPALLSAAAVMAEADDPARPKSMTIMGSPIDTRRSPTVPNLLSKERSPDWFQRNMIHSVPAPYPGVLRRVYPGFIQLFSFITMNHDRHISAHYDYFTHLVEGDGDSADKHRQFYDEYLSVLDMTEEFYMQTIVEVFQRHSLPDGVFMHRDRLVRPSLIRDIALMTVEGENDDISGIGQTQASHDLCSNIPDAMKIDHIQPKVGHYGVFNGSRWRNEIQPKIADFMRRADQPAKKAKKSA